MRSHRHVALAVAVVCGVLLAGCSSPTETTSPPAQDTPLVETPSPTTPATDPSSTEAQILDALGPCEIYEGGYETTRGYNFEAGVEEYGLIFVIVRPTPQEAQDVVDVIAERRVDDDRFRGLAILDNWVLDTVSAEAMELAVEMGAEVVLEIGPE